MNCHLLFSQCDTLRVICVEKSKSFIDNLTELEPNMLIAITAIIVSIVGLYFSVSFNRKTIRYSIRHNKLSVEPLLSHTYILMDFDRHERLELKNCGLGPARIKSLKFIYKDGSFDSIVNLYFKYEPSKTTYLKKKSITLFYNENDVLSQNDTVVIHNLFYDDHSEVKGTREILKAAFLCIDFETIYNEKRQYKAPLLNVD